MEFGVPAEVRDLEHRVGLTPAGVLALTQAGHQVYVERNAGETAGFGDEDYRRAGAQIVYSAAEAYGRADVVVKVTRPTEEEHRHFRHGQTILSFLHLAVSSPDLLDALTEREITAIAYELVQRDDGCQPVLVPMSQAAGRLAPIVAGKLLTTPRGGRGTLLSGLAGVPAAAVVILGGGVLGFSAARAFWGVGAQVTVIDKDMKKLRHIEEFFDGRVNTVLYNEFNLKRAVAFADVLVGAVQIPGQRAPILVTREMVRSMRKRSVIMDFSIDSGGCVETSRPTTIRDQTFVEEGVIHFCVPNLTAIAARTVSYALTNAALPYLLTIGNAGIDHAIKTHPALRNGTVMYEGKLAHAVTAAALGKTVEISLPQGGTSV